MEKSFSQILIGASMHFLKSIVYILFIVPFDVWKKALTRMAVANETGSFRVGNIGGLWPFLSFIKMLWFEFAFDAMIFLCYPLGLIVALVSLGDGFGAFLVMLIGAYYFPLFFALFRDFAQLMLIPFRKFLSWGSKPAQQLDIDLFKKN